jgi:hypothetical protein
MAVEEKEFRCLIDWRVRATPFPLEKERQEIIDNFLNKKAKYFGYYSWEDAYYRMPGFKKGGKNA